MQNRKQKKGCFTRPFVIAVLLSCRAAFAVVTVSESTPSRLVLNWELTGFDTVALPGVSGKRVSVHFDGGSVPTGDSGAALLYAYSVHAGVPQRGAARVFVESQEASVIRLSSPLQRRFAAVDSTEPRFVSRWVSEPVYGMFRGYRAAHILLRPIYDMGQGRIQVLKRARIVVEFPESAHTGQAWAPRGEYERMAGRMLLNFGVAQGWHASSARGLRRKAAGQGEPYPFAAGERLAVFKVGDGNRDLNEGLTNENSLIKIRGSAIRKVFGAGARFASVALYASHQGKMDELVPSSMSYTALDTAPVPAFDDVPAGVYEVPLLRYDLNGNGVVDDDDYVVAYVGGASDWGFERQFEFNINQYDDSRTYWLAVKGAGDGLRMERYVQPAAGGAATRGVFEANLYLRTPQYHSAASDNHEGGLEWVWKKFTHSKADTVIRLELPGIDESLPGSIAFIAGSRDGGALSADIGAVKLCSGCVGSPVAVADWSSRNLLIRYGGTTASDAYYELSAVHVRYKRPLALGGAVGKLEVFSAAEAETVRYRLSNAAGGGLAYIVRVPANGRAVSLVDTVRGASYEWNDTGGAGVRYMVMLERELVDYSDSIAARVVGGEVRNAQYQKRDLRNNENEREFASDFLIITHEEFLDAAIRLAAHKAGMGFHRPRIVLTGDILDQFGGGNTDPVAIRNFLFYVYGNWKGCGDGGVLSYVTLMGAGHYDYKNISSRAANFMPVPYISGRLNDDFYAFFDVKYHPNSQHNSYYFLGRMPVRNLTEAFDMVDKVIENEDPKAAEFDAWRSRVLLSADDDQQGAKADRTKPTHTASSEDISRIISAKRPDIDQRKVYLFEYGWDERYFKPAATRALINEINGGAALVNWFGHGDIGLLADERLLTKEAVSAFENRKRYPFFSIFSCSVGRFDQPGDESLASLLVRQAKGGGVAVIASAREVFADQNEYLAAPFFEALFDSSGGAGVSIGSALAAAKSRYATQNNRYYVLLGDPSIKLFGSGNAVALKVTDTSGTRRLDTLKALQQVLISGTVDGADGDSAYVALFNPPQDSVRRKDGGHVDTVTRYSLPGSPVFTAKIPVENGKFERVVRLPMNLAFRKPGVKLTAHVWKKGAGVAGAGYLDGLVFDGDRSLNADLSDTAGPKISVRPVYYKDGTTETDDAMNGSGLFVKNRITAQLRLILEVIIEDESGVNKEGAGPDEGLTVEVKGALSKRNIENFDFDPGSSTRGKATIVFENGTLGAGTYELVIGAQDLLGNVSKLSVVLEIIDPADIQLDHVMNVPNPVKMGQPTRFYYTHSNVTGDLAVNVTIRVYSLGGRLLAVIRNPRNGEPWVPRDGKGNYLTPNVYLYQITAASANVGKTVKSKIKKLAVHPPR
jgi:hypothetical protein